MLYLVVLLLTLHCRQQFSLSHWLFGPKSTSLSRELLLKYYLLQIYIHKDLFTDLMMQGSLSLYEKVSLCLRIVSPDDDERSL